MVSPRAFAVIWAVLLPLIALAGWGSVGPVAGALATIGGLLFWFVFEYAMHRYLFHWQARWAPVRWVVFLIHGNHHEDPNDPMRNLMPPVLSVPIALAVWAAFYALCGPAGTWAFLGFMIGYVLYDLIHFACHQWPMKGAFGQALKRHHMRHHYVDPEKNFAITAIGLDRVFGSAVTSVRG
ncbi:sterol desaturase family protein [Novosphingobium sp. 1949]|uniref:Sterol desaturase family protein n=1 Tax=Novosphingobium organovorum TaxID=2930092 RepID=A0ABT0BIK9_9SPHN|nr:sterol desaturase family protein [Novosphingobium organovorum]MCJ2184884.1 sterol desaturase family protein [Novosphingobium organovorum]